MTLRRSALLLFLFATVPLFAQSPPPERKTGLTFSIGSGDNAIALRCIVSPQWMVLGILGFSHGDNGVVGSIGSQSSVTSWALGAGVRRVFVSEELRPFVEFDASVRRTQLPGCGHISSPFGSLSGGVEYFVAKRVSIEGSAGVNYINISERCSSSDFGEIRYDAHTLSTFRSALSVTFYF